MHLEQITQVNKFIEGAKLGETDIFQHFINFTQVFLALGPLLLDFSVWVPGHLFPVLDEFVHAVDTTFSYQPNVMIFLFSTLLDCLNVFESLYFFLGLFMPPLHLFACHECHESILLDLNYILYQQVPLLLELIINSIELTLQIHGGLCGALIVFDNISPC
jgi:hypothetical protein